MFGAGRGQGVPLGLSLFSETKSLQLLSSASLRLTPLGEGRQLSISHRFCLWL